MREINGDLFEHLDGIQRIVLPHVCNDARRWNSGFVVPLAEHFPESRSRYMNAMTKEMTQGNTQYVLCDYRPQVVVANMVAQRRRNHTVEGDRPLSYRALSQCMESVRRYAKNTNSRIVCPRFGSLRAGGNWLFVKELIQDFWVAEGIDVTICHLDNG